MAPSLILLCQAVSLPPARPCSILPEFIRQEIWNHKDDVDKILDYILHGAGHHRAHSRLANLTDKYGHRLTGSKVLEDSIDYVMGEMRMEGFTNVHGESFQAPNYKRGEERCELVEPRAARLPILGLGLTISTPPDGIKAEAIVVESFEELAAHGGEAQGKIVVYNQPWKGYSDSVEYRRRGASEAAKVGAVAALVRSITQFSVNSPHTGMQTYEEGVREIPVACITVEDAEMLHRMHKRGLKIVIDVYIESETNGTVTTRNLVGDLEGSKFPDQYVVIGGHIDSWDVGTGAMDDAGGCVISWEAMAVIKDLNLRPKRTVRTVMWSAEEQGRIGGPEYYEANKEISRNISLIMESDGGTFFPKGIGFTGSVEARAIMQEIVDMTSAINTTTLGGYGGAPDISDWLDDGVPGGNIITDNADYFIFHHSEGDRMTVEDADNLDLCTAVWTVVTYVVANLEDMLPREGDPLPTISGAAQQQLWGTTITIVVFAMMLSMK